MTQTTHTEFTFPCEYPIKIMGLANETFEKLVMPILQTHIPDLKKEAISTRASKGGKYTALTVTFQATSKAQVDALYQDLTSKPEVIMVL